MESTSYDQCFICKERFLCGPQPDSESESEDDGNSCQSCNKRVCDKCKPSAFFTDKSQLVVPNRHYCLACTSKMDKCGFCFKMHPFFTLCCFRCKKVSCSDCSERMWTPRGIARVINNDPVYCDRKECMLPEPAVYDDVVILWETSTSDTRPRFGHLSDHVAHLYYDIENAKNNNNSNTLPVNTQLSPYYLHPYDNQKVSLQYIPGFMHTIPGSQCKVGDHCIAHRINERMLNFWRKVQCIQLAQHFIIIADKLPPTPLFGLDLTQQLRDVALSPCGIQDLKADMQVLLKEYVLGKLNGSNKSCVEKSL